MTTAPFAPNEEQSAIIDSDARRIVVSAGAGTGKTATLAARYVRLVQGGESPRAILCVTYTNKAAAEMKGRIVARLLDAGLSRPAQEAETGPIQTMHSFYERVLKENAVAAGHDPGFTILDDTEGGRILRAAVREAVFDLPEGPEERADYEELAEILVRDDGRRGTDTERAERVAKTLIDGWSRLGLAPHSVREALPARGWAAVEVELLRALLTDDVRAVIEEEGGADDLRGGLAKLRDAFGKDFARQVPSVVRGLLGTTDSSLRDHRLAHAAMLFATGVWRRMLAEEERRSAFSFASLERRSVAMLEDDPRIAARLRRRFRHVMVDESQDMNPLRYRFLEAMDPENLLFVGDGQQSIYLFQGADRELFTQTQGADKAAEPHALTRNYRSRPAILNFVEASFAPGWGEGYLRLEPHRKETDSVAEEIDGFDPFGSPTLPPRVFTVSGERRRATIEAIRRFQLDGYGLGQIAVLWRRRDLKLLADLDRAGIPYRVVGGNERFWTKRETRDLANALLAIADPDDRLAALAALRSPVGGFSLGATLRLADTNGRILDAEPTFASREDREAWARFMAWYPGLVALADHLPAWEILARVVAESPFLANLARYEGRDQAIANVRKLLADATRRPEESLGELVRTLREVRKLRSRDGEAMLHEDDAPLVTVITVHRAKGLEWDAVVFHHAGEGKWSGRDPAIVDFRSPAFGLNFEERGSRIFRTLRELAERREEEEYARVDYVAATRAREALAIVLDGKRRLLAEGAERLGPRAVGKDLPGRITSLAISLSGDRLPLMILRAACVQFAPVKAETERNLDAIAEYAAQAIGEGARLVVFPEAATSGYFLEGGVTQIALTPKELHGMLSMRLREWPEETGIVVGHYERGEDGEVYNAATLLLRGGPAATHRKMFLPTYGVFDEERFVSRGDRLTSVKFAGIQTSLLICEDVWHAITPTLAAMQGAALMIVPSASPARGFGGEQVANHLMYRRICESISGEHGVFAVNAQLVGFEGGKGFIGGSVITDPFGDVIAEGPVGREAIVVADLDLDLVGIARAQSPLLSDKRTMWPRLMKIASELG